MAKLQVTHYRSENEMALSLGVHRNTVARMVSRPDFPQKMGKKGWLKTDVNKFFITLKQKLADQQAGPNAELKRTKLQREIDKLEREIKQRDLEIASEEGKRIPVEEHQASLREAGQIFKDVLGLWISAVRVLTADAKLVTEAERLRDQAWARIQERVKS